MKTVGRLTLDFEHEPTSQKTKMMTAQTSQKVIKEINKLIVKDAIEHTDHEKGDFISPIFFLSKSDETSRLTMNFKIFREFLENNHFKMETVH